MQAVIIVGHGSLRPGSGAAMIRLAARVREAGVAPLVSAGFLNYSRPPFAETLARAVARGASEVVVQPYFLIPGRFVSVDVPRLVAAGRAAHPAVRFALAGPLGDHPALAELVLRRARAIGGAPSQPAALLIIAHGSPDPAANWPIAALAERVQAMGLYAAVEVCYLGLNAPLIAPAIDSLVRRGVARIDAVPYFLQLGGHVAADLPAAIDAARARHPAVALGCAEHLGYDVRLAQVVAQRVREACTAGFGV